MVMCGDVAHTAIHHARLMTTHKRDTTNVGGVLQIILTQPRRPNVDPVSVMPPSSLVTLAVQFAKHFETGETLPNDLFEKLCAQRTYMAGSGMLRQLYFGQVCYEYDSQMFCFFSHICAVCVFFFS